MEQRTQSIKYKWHLKDNVFMLTNLILLWCVWERALWYNSFINQKIMNSILPQNQILKFWCMWKLSLNVSQKNLEYGKHFRFRSKKIHPCKLPIVIYECHKILEMNMTNNWWNVPKITINNIKTLCSTTTKIRKRKSFTFA